MTAMRYPLSAFILAGLLIAIIGCHRSYYRRKADEEVYGLVGQKSENPRWPLDGYTIDVDARSRMYSPFSIDHPPMPPDDPSSHKLMHYVDDKQGYPYWHVNGDTPVVENPLWMKFLPLDENGVLKLDHSQAVLTALMQSPEYQEQLETLYLSALDVSFERFRFDSQFFGGYTVDYAADGPDRARDNGDSSSVLTVGTFPAVRGIRMTKLGTTGSSLVVGLANRLLWQFSGNDNYSATTLLDFSLIQPLLRGAGRDRVMETLTLSERTLLANVRQMERYRRGFYFDIFTGQGAGAGPQRRGGFFGASGFGGFAGVGGGGFGGVGNAGFGGGGTGGGQASGYLGLLQTQQNIRNQQTNVSQLRNILPQFIALYEANRIDNLQVQQVRQDLYDAQSRLLNDRTEYQNSLDNFKGDLGLPPKLDIQIDDDLLDQLELLDRQVLQRQDEFNALQQQIGDVVTMLLNRINVPWFDWLFADGNKLEWDGNLVDSLQSIQQQLADAQQVREQVAAVNMPRVAEDLDKFKNAIPDRIKNLNRLRQRVEEQSRAGEAPDVEPSVFATGRLPETLSKLTKEFAAIESRMAALAEAIDGRRELIGDLLTTGEELDPITLEQAVQGNVIAPTNGLLAEMSSIILELSLIQAEARTETVGLVPIELSSDVALEIARDYRRDWMNARAALVNSWRLIEFNADNLESDLDIVFEGDISNFGDNPLNLQASTGRLRAGIQFDAPITRLDQRNTYRQSLIEYAQARRSYYQTVDAISRNLRSIIRSLELNELNFEVRRQAILIAIDNVLLSRLRLEEPPQPDQVGQQRLGATTARDLVGALSSLQQAQDAFLSVWVTYEVLRISLDFNLGTMELDEQGLWIDPGPITAETGLPGPPPLGDAYFCPPLLFAPDEVEWLDAESTDGAAEEVPTPPPGSFPSSRPPGPYSREPSGEALPEGASLPRDFSLLDDDHQRAARGGVRQAGLTRELQPRSTDLLRGLIE